MGNSVEKWTETYSFFLIKNKKLKNDLEIQINIYLKKIDDNFKK